MFPCSLDRTKDEVEHPWCLFYLGEFLGVLSSNFAIFRSNRRSPTHEYNWKIDALNLVTLGIDILRFLDNSI